MPEPNTFNNMLLPKITPYSNPAICNVKVKIKKIVPVLTKSNPKLQLSIYLTTINKKSKYSYI